MKVSKIDNQQNQIIFSINIDNNLWKTNLKKAMENAAKNVRIEGFRKGKVPVQLAEKYINKNNVYEKAINKVINEIVPKFEESNDFKNIPDELLEKPVINVDKANDNELSISLAYDKMPKIKLKDYKKIPLDWSKIKQPTNDDVNREINFILERNKKLNKITTRPLKLNDVATIDFVGKINGKEFLGGKAEDYNLKIGSKSFIDNFEDQLIGMNINDKRVVNVKFPSNYQAKEYADKKAEFTVTLKAINEEQDNELNDEFVKSLKFENVNTVKELKDFLLKSLKNQALSQFRSIYQKQLLIQIANLVEPSYIPKGLMQEEQIRMRNIFVNNLQKQKISLDQYLKKTKLKLESLDHTLSEDAKHSILYAFGIEQIAKENNIQVNESDFDEYISYAARLYNLPVNDIKKQVEDKKDYISQDLLNEKVINFLIDLNLKNWQSNKSQQNNKPKADKKEVPAASK